MKITCPEKEFEIEDGVLKRYNDMDSSVAIPEGVTEIGERAFEGCEAIASVTIPEGVTKIGREAFWSCKSFASVSIPKSVTEIGREAFGYCESLAEIRYGGTKAQWEMLRKGAVCFLSVAADSVRCTDGMAEIGLYKDMSGGERSA